MPRFPMEMIRAATKLAISQKKQIFIFHDGNKWVQTANQPSRFRTHWKIDTKGNLFQHEKPDVCSENAKLNYKAYA